MLGGLFGLSFVQHSYLFIAQIMPIISAITGIYGFNDGLISIIMINIVYIIIPTIYIRYLSKEGEITAYFINELRNKSLQVQAGIKLCSSAFGMVLLAYAFTYFFDEQVDANVKFPIQHSIIYLLFFFIIFMFINPMLEELYWRIFLMKTYKESDMYRILINLAYTAMHFVILSKILNFESAIGFSTYFYSVSRAFEYIREKHGLITCLLTHYGMTMASTIALGTIIAVQIKNEISI